RLQHPHGRDGPRRRWRVVGRGVPHHAPRRAAARGPAGAAVSPAALGALLGLAAGTGAWWVVLRLAARRPTLDARLAPYLRPAPEPPPAASVLERLLAPVMRDAVRLVERLGSPTAELERRLARAGEETGVEE